MPEPVVYQIDLQDLVSGKLHQAEGHALHFEKALGGVKNALSGIKELALKAFAAFEVFEFVKESVTDFNEFAQANAQLAASLKSTGNAAGLTTKALREQSEELADSTLFDDKVITRQQSILLTFTQIKGAIYNEAMPAILDLSSKMGEDLTSATVQVGKALNDPIRGMTALRRVGVAFSADQEKVIKNLVHTGQVAKAQQLIIKELNTEFGGSAKANAQVGTGPFVLLGHLVDDIKENLGSAVVEIAKTLLPLLKTAITVIADVFKFINEHIGVVVDKVKSLFSALGLGLKNLTPTEIFDSFIATLKKVVNWLKPITDTIMPIINSVVRGVKSLIGPLDQFSGPLMNLLTWVRDILAEALTKLPPVIDFIFQAVAKVVDVLHTVYVFLEKMKIIWLIGKMLQVELWLINEIGKALGWIWDNILKPIFDRIEKWYDKIKGWLGIKATADLTTNETVKTTMEKMTGGDKPTLPTLPKVPKTGTGMAGASGKVTGSKTTTFNIKIDKIGCDLTIKTTNIKEAGSKLHDIVTQALLAAVNDSQLVLAD
jgi:phage-related protein